MIDDFFEHPYTLRYLRGGVTGPHIDAFAGALAEQAFTIGRARALLRGVAHLGRWLQKRRTPLAALGEGVLEAFRAHLSRCRCVRRNKGRLYYCRSGSNRFLTWAREQGLVSASAPAAPVPPLIRDFEAWMLQHRNVAPSTLTVAYRLHLRRFLAAVGDDPRGYTAAGIRAFVLAQSQRRELSRAKHAVTAIRMLLRHLAVSGRCMPELIDAVPTVAHWRLGPLPRYLSRDIVNRIVASCDPTTARGRRDRAVLLLLARLGLRAGDVAALRLDDLDWSGAAVTVFGKARREVRLPLPQEVGDAILAWLSGGRPRRDDEHVFFGLRAPIGPLARILGGENRGKCSEAHRYDDGPRRDPRAAPLRRHRLVARGHVAHRDRRAAAPSEPGDDRDLRQGRHGPAQHCGAPLAGGGVAVMGLIADYLAVRRAVGFKLRPTESRLRSFARHALEHGDTGIRSETAVAWAGAADSPSERRCRLRTVVLFARHLSRRGPHTRAASQRFLSLNVSTAPPAHLLGARDPPDTGRCGSPRAPGDFARGHLPDDLRAPGHHRASHQRGARA